MLGPTMEVTERYQDYQRGLDGSGKVGGLPSFASNQNRTLIMNVVLGGDCVDGTIDTNGRLEVLLTARLEPSARSGCHVGLKITRNDGICCYGVSSQLEGVTLRGIEGDLHGIRFVVERLPLLAGEYAVDVHLLDAKGIHRLDGQRGAAFFRVRQHTTEMGVARLQHRWEDP
jgi:hypothetical protein